MATKKIIPQHKDILDVDITEDSYVAVPRNSAMNICSIIKINPKMIRVKPVTSTRGGGYLVYPHEILVLDPHDVLAYKLKKLK